MTAVHVYVHAAVKQEAHVAFRASARCPSWRLIALFLEVETDENLTDRYPPIECFALQDVRRARPCRPGSALPSRCRDRPLREVCRRRLFALSQAPSSNLHRQLPFKSFSQWLPHLVETLMPVPLTAWKNLQRRVDQWESQSDHQSLWIILNSTVSPRFCSFSWLSLLPSKLIVSRWARACAAFDCMCLLLPCRSICGIFRMAHSRQTGIVYTSIFWQRGSPFLSRHGKTPWHICYRARRRGRSCCRLFSRAVLT